jgi:hypothetical protein
MATKLFPVLFYPSLYSSFLLFLGFLIIEFDFYVENEKFKILIFWG